MHGLYRNGPGFGRYNYADGFNAYHDGRFPNAYPNFRRGPQPPPPFWAPAPQLNFNQGPNYGYENRMYGGMRTPMRECDKYMSDVSPSQTF